MRNVAVGVYKFHECGRQFVGHFETWRIEVDSEFCMRKCQHNFQNLVQNRTAATQFQGRLLLVSPHSL